MASKLAISVLVLMAASSVFSQGKGFNDPLLESMVGRWVLQGTIDGKETKHDIVAEWILGHEYLKFHEVSREKNSSGISEYEAIVLIGIGRKSQGYACLWLDTTSGIGLSNQGIAQGKREGDQIKFLFYGSSGSIFHTTFVYDRRTDTWQWIMDGEEGGKLQPFARVKLTRK
jgi:hypothetical protein